MRQGAIGCRTPLFLSVSGTSVENDHLVAQAGVAVIGVAALPEHSQRTWLRTYCRSALATRLAPCDTMSDPAFSTGQIAFNSRPVEV